MFPEQAGDRGQTSVVPSTGVHATTPNGNASLMNGIVVSCMRSYNAAHLAHGIAWMDALNTQVFI